jgi:hypothetical protein
MSIFGEKCMRCGDRRTKAEYEGLPTCQPCEDELRARSRASDEDRRACPIDGELMDKDVVLNVVIDRCATCKGIWLDGGELDLIRGAVAEGMVLDLVRMPLPF